MMFGSTNLQAYNGIQKLLAPRQVRIFLVGPTSMDDLDPQIHSEARLYGQILIYRKTIN